MLGRCSSAAEQGSHKPRVGGSIPPTATNPHRNFRDTAHSKEGGGATSGATFISNLYWVSAEPFECLALVLQAKVGIPLRHPESLMAENLADRVQVHPRHD